MGLWKFICRKLEFTYWMRYLVLGCLLLQGCLGYKRTPTSDLLEEGRKYKITTKDGKKKKFKMATINDSILTGTTASGKIFSIHLKEIDTIKKRKFSIFKTAGLTGLLVASYVFIKKGDYIGIDLGGLQVPN